MTDRTACRFPLLINCLVAAALVLLQGIATAAHGAGDLGLFARWEKIEITLAGPDSTGSVDPNPFALTVDGMFTAPSGKTQSGRRKL